MNNYIVIMNRKTSEALIVLRYNWQYDPRIVFRNYAEWLNVDSKDLLYTEIICADYNDILSGKVILDNVA